ncbi:MAG TPA: hypothetical protein VFZ34_20110 [Blastocatellia bacterium]|nr:hypothetical protein [Blastocatellia bacterium]
MSDKDRRKKDGQDKNKKNQARRAAETPTGAKNTRSTQQHTTVTSVGTQNDARTERESPAAARMAASKTHKGK